ncbi:hypothetical protein [uncultured Maribacter sp.]|uniref:hypothetical protein n=1 Tax=uncultured Maribacter sp. TaxID=431308 RepID=UPI0030ED8358|tara:strand:- start:368 stop:850 length:483 start_codon:yes stop_codon:yes gene_type:complete
MNKILMIFLLIFQVTFSQTKEETVEWLNLNLENYGDNQIMGTYQIETKVDPNYGETILFTQKSWNPLMEKNTFDYFSFKPDAISSIYLSGKGRTNKTLDIYIKSKSNRIYDSDEEKFLGEFRITMKNGHNDKAEQLQTGLLHLFELLGNKLEKPKDLFKN